MRFRKRRTQLFTPNRAVPWGSCGEVFFNHHKNTILSEAGAFFSSTSVVQLASQVEPRLRDPIGGALGGGAGLGSFFDVFEVFRSVSDVDVASAFQET